MSGRYRGRTPFDILSSSSPYSAFRVKLNVSLSLTLALYLHVINVKGKFRHDGLYLSFPWCSRARDLIESDKFAYKFHKISTL